MKNQIIETLKAAVVAAEEVQKEYTAKHGVLRGEQYVVVAEGNLPLNVYDGHYRVGSVKLGWFLSFTYADATAVAQKMGLKVMHVEELAKIKAQEIRNQICILENM